jgi:hypothetical protein
MCVGENELVDAAERMRATARTKRGRSWQTNERMVCTRSSVEAGAGSGQVRKRSDVFEDHESERDKDECTAVQGLVV